VRAVHKVADVIRLGLHSLMVHAVQSILTALGIIFGVCGVIAMLATSAGMAEESQRYLRELGSDNIIIEAVKPPEEDKASDQTRGALQYGLTLADVIRLRSMPGLRRCVTIHRISKTIRVRHRQTSAAIIATEPTFVKVARVRMQAGRFISSADMLRRKAHCVLTGSLAKRLFPIGDPLGQTIRVGSDPFVVIGVLARPPRVLAGGVGGEGANYLIIPMATDRARFGRYSVKRSKGTWEVEQVEVSQVILQMADEQAVLDGAIVAKRLLEKYHDRLDYEVQVPLELIEQRKKQLALWHFMFLMIASVSLVVGGIGIMNIMLASVNERTREIGVRRALGAKRRDITAQFLVEAVTQTTVGGLVGIAIGLAVPWIIERYLGFPTIVSAWTLLLPFLMAVGVGLASGLYPAFRAARLDPITALRHE